MKLWTMAEVPTRQTQLFGELMKMRSHSIGSARRLDKTWSSILLVVKVVSGKLMVYETQSDTTKC